MGVWRDSSGPRGDRCAYTAVVLGLALAGACDRGGDSMDSDTEATSEDTTAGTTSSGSDGSTSEPTSTTSAGPGTSGTSVTGDPSGGSTSDGSDTQASATNPTTDSGGFMPISCALEDMDPEADPAAVLDYGDEPGQIPTIVGEVLLRNCGCHYTDNVVMVVDYTFENAQQLSTLEQFQSNFLGTLPFEYNDRPTYEAVEQRVIFENPLPMPTFECAVEGTEPPVSMTDEDKAVLQAWFDAEAPDGATFVYP